MSPSNKVYKDSALGDNPCPTPPTSAPSATTTSMPSGSTATPNVPDADMFSSRAAPAPPVLEADDREKTTRLEAVARKTAYRFEKKRLDTCDYILGSAYAFEYKTIQDFANDKGHDLWQKLDAVAAYPFPFLVLEGQMDHNARESNPRWRYNRGAWEAAKAQVNGALASILEARKVSVLYVSSETDFADWLAVFAKRLQREGREYQRPVETRKPAKRTLSEEAEDVAVAISGIGRKAAKQLLERFKSLRGLSVATAKEIEELDGFGKAKANHIEEVFKHDYGN